MDNFGRPRRPWQMYEADDGTIYMGVAATIFSNSHWEAGGFAGLQRDVGHGFETQAEWRQRTHRTHVIKTSPRRRRPHGRAARPATNARRRGSRRASGEVAAELLFSPLTT